MALYLMEAKQLAHRFSRLLIARIPRAQNMRADALARSTSAHSSALAPAIESLTTSTVMPYEVAEMNVPPS